MEDREIVALFWRRDPQAIAESDSKYGAYCRAIAARICQSPEDGEECVNDTWFSAWNAMPDKRPDRLGPFFARIARNHALHRVEAAGRLKRGGGETGLALEELGDCIGTGDGPAQALEQKELMRAVHIFLAGLRPQERHIFLARYFYLLPIKEIAARLDCSQGKVKRSLFRSREKLRGFLTEEGYL